MVMHTTITAVSVHMQAVSCLDCFRLFLSIVSERGPVCVCDLNTIRHNSIYSSLFSLSFLGVYYYLSYVELSNCPFYCGI